MLRSFALLLAFALLAAACGRGEDAAPDTSAPAASTTTSLALSSTSSVTATTEPEPHVTVTVDLEGDDEAMASAVAAVYTAALNPAQDTEVGLPPGLVEQFSDRPPRSGDTTVTGSIATGRVLDTDIAVFVAGDDVILLSGRPGAPAGTSRSWQVVGAKLASLEEPAWYGPAPRTVLVIGSDARPGQSVTGFRADSIHIITVRAADGEGSIVGIPRDSWVEASYGGKSKLTNTMASRGPEVVLETVRRLTGLELEGYLVTGFKGFEGLVDAFGGFEMDVPYGMADPKSNAYFRAGPQPFDGADALAFARNRTDTPNGDFGRQFNHGLLMLAALPEVQSRGVAALPALLELLTMFVITDLEAGDLLAIGAASFELSPESVTNVVAPGRVGSTSGGASVVFLGDKAFELFEDVADGRVDGDY